MDVKKRNERLPSEEILLREECKYTTKIKSVYTLDLTCYDELYGKQNNPGGLFCLLYL